MGQDCQGCDGKGKWFAGPINGDTVCDWCQGSGVSSPWTNPIGTRAHINKGAGVTIDFEDQTINVNAPTTTKTLFSFLKATWPGHHFDIVSHKDFGPWSISSGHHHIRSGEWYQKNRTEFAFRADLSDYPKYGRIECWYFQEDEAFHSMMVDLTQLYNHTHVSILPAEGEWTVKYGMHIKKCTPIKAVCGVKRFKWQG